MVVTDRPFIPPSGQAAPGSSSQQSTGQMKGKKATQPVEAPSAFPGSQQMEVPGNVSATRPVEAPGANTENFSTDQDAPLSASIHRTGSRSDLQFQPRNTVSLPLVPQSLLRNRHRRQEMLVTIYLVLLMKARCLT